MKLIAHRGASGTFPENTRASFRAALQAGAQAVEFDVQRTRDGRLAVIHDTDLRRLAGRRAKVGMLDFAELSSLDVGSWLDSRFRGERVPSLEETLDLFPGHLEVHLEIKQARPLYRGIEEEVLRALRSRPGLRDRVVLSSFHHPTLRSLRALDAGVRLGFLAGPMFYFRAAAQAKALGCESLNISLRQASPRRVRSAHAGGLRVLVYTVNRREDARRLKAMGVDGVFTDFLERLKDAA